MKVIKRTWRRAEPDQKFHLYSYDLNDPPSEVEGRCGNTLVPHHELMDFERWDEQNHEVADLCKSCSKEITVIARAGK